MYTIIYCTIHSCRYVVIHADDRTSILSSISTLQSALREYIEPDFGLVTELLRLDVLTRSQLADVRSERTVYRRNDALLDMFVTEDKCIKFLEALQRTDQQHVVNFIIRNGGQKHNDVVT